MLDRTKVPVRFSNERARQWSMRVMELTGIQEEGGHSSRQRLEDLLAEHVQSKSIRAPLSRFLSAHGDEVCKWLEPNHLGDALCDISKRSVEEYRGLYLSLLPGQYQAVLQEEDLAHMNVCGSVQEADEFGLLSYLGYASSLTQSLESERENGAWARRTRNLSIELLVEWLDALCDAERLSRSQTRRLQAILRDHPELLVLLCMRRKSSFIAFMNRLLQLHEESFSSAKLFDIEYELLLQEVSRKSGSKLRLDQLNDFLKRWFDAIFKHKRPYFTKDEILSFLPTRSSTKDEEVQALLSHMKELENASAYVELEERIDQIRSRIDAHEFFELLCQGGLFYTWENPIKLNETTGNIEEMKAELYELNEEFFAYGCHLPRLRESAWLDLQDEEASLHMFCIRLHRGAPEYALEATKYLLEYLEKVSLSADRDVARTAFRMGVLLLLRAAHHEPTLHAIKDEIARLWACVAWMTSNVPRNFQFSRELYEVSHRLRDHIEAVDSQDTLMRRVPESLWEHEPMCPFMFLWWVWPYQIRQEVYGFDESEDVSRTGDVHRYHSSKGYSSSTKRLLTGLYRKYDKRPSLFAGSNEPTEVVFHDTSQEELIEVAQLLVRLHSHGDAEERSCEGYLETLLDCLLVMAPGDRRDRMLEHVERLYDSKEPGSVRWTGAYGSGEELAAFSRLRRQDAPIDLIRLLPHCDLEKFFLMARLQGDESALLHRLADELFEESSIPLFGELVTHDCGSRYRARHMHEFALMKWRDRTARRLCELGSPQYLERLGLERQSIENKSTVFRSQLAGAMSRIEAHCRTRPVEELNLPEIEDVQWQSLLDASALPSLMSDFRMHVFEKDLYAKVEGGQRLLALWPHLTKVLPVRSNDAQGHFFPQAMIVEWWQNEQPQQRHLYDDEPRCEEPEEDFKARVLWSILHHDVLRSKWLNKHGLHKEQEPGSGQTIPWEVRGNLSVAEVIWPNLHPVHQQRFLETLPRIDDRDEALEWCHRAKACFDLPACFTKLEKFAVTQGLEEEIQSELRGYVSQLEPSVFIAKWLYKRDKAPWSSLGWRIIRGKVLMYLREERYTTGEAAEEKNETLYLQQMFMLILAGEWSVKEHKTRKSREKEEERVAMKKTIDRFMGEAVPRLLRALEESQFAKFSALHDDIMRSIKDHDYSTHCMPEQMRLYNELLSREENMVACSRFDTMEARKVLKNIWRGAFEMPELYGIFPAELRLWCRVLLSSSRKVFWPLVHDAIRNALVEVEERRELLTCFKWFSEVDARLWYKDAPGLS